MSWTTEYDELLCLEVLQYEPYAKKPFTRERGQAWSNIAKTLNSLPQAKSCVTQRSVQERFSLLEKRYKDKVRKEERASGIDVEESPTDALLEEIIEKSKVAEFDFEQQSIEQSAKVEVEKCTAEDMRQKALETLSETMKRKEGSSETTKKVKRPRNTGSETLIYLREKVIKEHEIKMQELEVKKQEQTIQLEAVQNQQATAKEQVKQQQALLEMFQNQMISQQEKSQQQQQQVQQHMLKAQQQMQQTQVQLLQAQQQQSNALMALIEKRSGKN